DRCPSEASGTCGAHPATVKRSDQATAPLLPCLWRIDMLSDSIRDRCPSEASGACGAHPAAVKRSDQPTAPRLPAQTATGFIGSAVCRCPLDTPGSTSLGRIRQPLVCGRGLDSGLAIHRNGDWRRVAAEARLGQVFALPGQYASDDG